MSKFDVEFDKPSLRINSRKWWTAVQNAVGKNSEQYRSPDGLKCAAGCLIADDEYDPRMEGSNWKEMYERGSVPNDHLLLIARLQAIHDRCPVKIWRERLEHVANEYNLTTENV